MNLQLGWIGQDCTSVAEVKDLVVMEQLIHMLRVDVRIFVKERKPKTSEQAHDNWQARKSSFGARQYQTCGKPGHLLKECRRNFIKPHETLGEKKTSSANQDRGKKDFKELECFNYHQKGHYASNCPQRAQFCMERRMDHKGQSITKRRQAQDYSGNQSQGWWKASL